MRRHNNRANYVHPIMMPPAIQVVNNRLRWLYDLWDGCIPNSRKYIRVFDLIRFYEDRLNDWHNKKATPCI